MEKYKKIKDTLTREDEIALLCKIVEDGRLHRELNKFVSNNAYRKMACETRRVREFDDNKKVWTIKYKSFYLDFPPGIPKSYVRKLLGLHDIESYLDDIKKSWRQPSIVVINGKRYSNPEAITNAYYALKAFLLAVRDNKLPPKTIPISPYYY